MANKRIYDLTTIKTVEDFDEHTWVWMDRQAPEGEPAEPSWKVRGDLFLKVLNNFATHFVPNVLTVVGKCYWHEGLLYRCTTAYSGAWVPGNFTLTSVDELFARKDVLSALQDALETTNGNVTALTAYSQNVAHSIASEFVPNKDYKKNDIVVRNGSLCRFKNDHPAGAWVSTDVVFVDIDTLLLDLMAGSSIVCSGVDEEVYLNSSGVETADTHYNVYNYNVNPGSQVVVATASGSGCFGFFDVNGNVVGSLFATPSPTNKIQSSKFLTVPSDAVELKVTCYISVSDVVIYPSVFSVGGFGIVEISKILKKLVESLAGEFIPTKDYEVNDRVIYKEILYKFIIHHDSGAWDSTEVERCNLSDVILSDSVNSVILPYRVMTDWLLGSTGEGKNSNYDLYKYNVEGLSFVSFTAATGGGKWAFYDSSDTLIGSMHSTAPNVNVMKPEYNVPVPANAVELKISNYKNIQGPAQYPVVVTNKGNGFAQSAKELKPVLAKRVLVIGDSITDMDLWTKTFEKLAGCVIWNRGVSGTCVAVRDGSTSSFCERFDLTESTSSSHSQGFPPNANVDVVIMWGGTNDWGRSIPLGSIDAAIDTTTFYGALRYMAEGLKARYPGKPIIFLSVMNAARSTRFENWNRVEFGSNGAMTFRTNDAGAKMSDYHDATKNVCDLYGIAYVDMFECGLSPISQYDYEHYTNSSGDPPVPDGLHPNQAGADIVARYLNRKIGNLV